MTLTMTNLIHEQQTRIDTSRARSWLHKNYQRHLSENGSIDAQALAEALAWDTALPLATALELAEDFKREMDGE